VVGQQVSHYEIISRLGTGGMGEIYEARDHRLGRRVALKFLPAELSRDEHAVERLQREARIASSLSHPHICTIHDIDAHQGNHFIVMELLDGVALADRIRSGPLSPRELIEISIQVASALDAAHKLGIVHRDIKPANIFLTMRGPVKVLDFGVAKLQPSQPPSWTSRETTSHGPDEQTPGPPTLAHEGVALGTIQYMSPEQARGGAIDGRSDLFSLGAVMYEMATGIPAFRGMTAAVVWDAILNRQPRLASEVRPLVPATLDRIIMRALEKDPANRYQSASDVAGELQRAHREFSDEVAMGRTAEFPARYVPTSLASTAHIRTKPAALRPRRRWGRYALAAAAVLGLAGAAAYVRRQSVPPLAERDLIVVTDFTNQTGDMVFDGALREAVDVQLLQSRWFRVLSEQRTISVLKLMGHTADTPVTGGLARDLCQRAGAQALVEGTIASLGSTYVITLDAQQCATGDSLAKEQVQAAGKDRVLEELDGATASLRKRLGESLQSIERFDTKIQEATTPSLEALRAYSLGVRARVREGDSAAIPFFRQALETDRTFALAHARLSVVYENLGDRQPARVEVQKAYELRERVSEYERLYIITRYHDIVTGDLEKRIETLRLLGDTFPRDFAARNNLGVAYLEAGRLDHAVEQFRTAVALGPDQRLPHMNLANTLVNLGRLDEARSLFDRTLAIGDSSDTRAGAFMRAYFAHDIADMDRQFEAGSAGGEPWLLHYCRSLAAAYQGHMSDAYRFVSQGIRAATDAGRPGAAARGWLQMAFLAVQVGDTRSARDAAAEALRKDRDVRTLLQAATVLALAGDVNAAAALVATAEEQTLVDTITRDVFRVQARAALALARGDAPGAHAMLDRSTGYERRYPELTWLRGLAHLRAADSAALTDFRTLLDNPWRGGIVIYPAMELHLARALAAAGDHAGAQAAYERFLAAWSSADANLTLLTQARREMGSVAAGS
jgi:eukaryotic-like serine/threonine-protein kinase